MKTVRIWRADGGPCRREVRKNRGKASPFRPRFGYDLAGFALWYGPGGVLAVGEAQLIVNSGSPSVASVHSSHHPLILGNIAALRDARTPPAEFRRLVRVTAMLLAYEAMADLPTRDVEIATPLATTRVKVPAETVAIVPILRAGLGMADGVLDVIPEAQVWHVGLRRDERTLQPEQYYTRLPERSEVGLALLLDPMLATGGSAIHACEMLKHCGVTRLKFLAILAAPEGIEKLSTAMPDVVIHVGVIDACLNDVGFIFPGLGDAGDRQFGTTQP